MMMKTLLSQVSLNLNEYFVLVNFISAIDLENGNYFALFCFYPRLVKTPFLYWNALKSSQVPYASLLLLLLHNHRALRKTYRVLRTPRQRLAQ